MTEVEATERCDCMGATEDDPSLEHDRSDHVQGCGGPGTSDPCGGCWDCISAQCWYYKVAP